MAARVGIFFLGRFWEERNVGEFREGGCFRPSGAWSMLQVFPALTRWANEFRRSAVGSGLVPSFRSRGWV